MSVFKGLFTHAQGGGSGGGGQVGIAFLSPDTFDGIPEAQVEGAFMAQLTLPGNTQVSIKSGWDHDGAFALSNDGTFTYGATPLLWAVNASPQVRIVVENYVT